MIKYYATITSNILEIFYVYKEKERDNSKDFYFLLLFLTLAVTGNVKVSFLQLCIMVLSVVIYPQIPIRKKSIAFEFFLT